MFGFDFIGMLLTIPGIVIGLTFHEFAHAYASDRLGDPTPRNQGRLTLSPMAHIDPIGFLFLMVFNFGWAKPVQVNTRYFKNPRRDDILVSAAGPFMNLLLALFFGLMLKLSLGGSLPGGSIYQNLQTILLKTVFINVILFILNLIPVPPLDGFHILAGFMPYRYSNIIYNIEKYGTFILILIIITPAANYIIGKPAANITSFILRIFGI